MLLIFGITPVAHGQKSTVLKKVVIDAGHGGHDPGTLGKKSREKDVTLAIALRLGQLIQENMPQVEVIFTRKTDVFIELFRRSEIANENKADLFISIHCNSSLNPVPRGVESWVMGLHKSKENLEVAKKENASILMEDNYTQYDGFNPNSPEANIIFSLYQNIYLDQSLAIASKVQEFATLPIHMPDRGVKQAGFWVLYKTTMPGLLIETGFLSNADDEEYLLGDNGKDEMASAIFKAFKAYKESFDIGKTIAVSDHRNSTTTAASVESQTENQTTPPARKSTEKAELVIEKTEPKVVESVHKTVKSDPKQEKPKTKTETEVSNIVVSFKVQFLSNPKKLPPTSPLFKGMKDYESYALQNSYKYVSGNFNNIADAKALQDKLRADGFPDAFVVAFYRGTRITIAEAKDILLK
ncbi:MAG: N-acetylmuramoyl-L-alanine amidase [Bacteroidota bacterium]